MSSSWCLRNSVFAFLSCELYYASVWLETNKDEALSEYGHNNIETMNEDYYLDTAPTHFGLANHSQALKYSRALYQD